MIVKILQILFLAFVLIVVLGTISGIILQIIYFRWNRKIIKLYQQGNYDAAIPLAQKAIELAKDRWNDKHPNVAISLNQLGLLYKSQGRYDKAESFYKKAIDINRLALPENHPNIAADLNNLARLYESQGRYAEAEKHYLEALAIDRIALPENHPSLATRPE
jgi:tetratricopeptide (TPR) repeat protein